MMMTQEERQQAKELAARMTPELMARVMAAPVGKASQEQAATAILNCCARVMMNGDPESRIEAYDLHKQVTRWVWNQHCDRQWHGTPVREVL